MSLNRSHPHVATLERSRSGAARRISVWVLLLALMASLGGCGWLGGMFGGNEAADTPAGPTDAGGGAGEGAGGAQAPKGPFAAGVLNTVSQRAPTGSPTQLLARLAAEFGWEDQVGQNPLLKEAVEEETFAERVEPILLGLYYKNGFSVLPIVGEGHQFNRDSVVRGAIGSSRLLVSTRDPVRILFLRTVESVQIVYYQDGTEPQVFTVDERSVVTVRKSLLKHYLR